MEGILRPPAGKGLRRSAMPRRILFFFCKIFFALQHRGFMLFWYAMRRSSLVGDRVFYDSEQFPGVVSALEPHWADIREELDTLLPRLEELPDFRTLTPGLRELTPFNNWRMFVFYAYGRRSERNCRRCPKTAEILKRVPGMKTAFFSILAPGTHITRHFGIYPGILRVHLGLRVPARKQDCWIKVGPTVRSWEEGRCLIFDDTYLHEVHNDTDQMRVVLFLDIKRPLGRIGDWLNEAIIFLLSRTGLIREGKKNEDDWERAFYEEADPPHASGERSGLPGSR
jgi:beta-hydroxylase